MHFKVLLGFCAIVLSLFTLSNPSYGAGVCEPGTLQRIGTIRKTKKILAANQGKSFDELQKAGKLSKAEVAAYQRDVESLTQKLLSDYKTQYSQTVRGVGDEAARSIARFKQLQANTKSNQNLVAEQKIRSMGGYKTIKVAGKDVRFPANANPSPALKKALDSGEKFTMRVGDIEGNTKYLDTFVAEGLLTKQKITVDGVTFEGFVFTEAARNLASRGLLDVELMGDLINGGYSVQMLKNIKHWNEDLLKIGADGNLRNSGPAVKVSMVLGNHDAGKIKFNTMFPGGKPSKKVAQAYQKFLAGAPDSAVSRVKFFYKDIGLAGAFDNQVNEFEGFIRTRAGSRAIDEKRVKSMATTMAANWFEQAVSRPGGDIIGLIMSERASLLKLSGEVTDQASGGRAVVVSHSGPTEKSFGKTGRAGSEPKNFPQWAEGLEETRLALGSQIVDRNLANMFKLDADSQARTFSVSRAEYDALTNGQKAQLARAAELDDSVKRFLTDLSEKGSADLRFNASYDAMVDLLTDSKYGTVSATRADLQRIDPAVRARMEAENPKIANFFREISEKGEAHWGVNSGSEASLTYGVRFMDAVKGMFSNVVARSYPGEAFRKSLASQGAKLVPVGHTPVTAVTLVRTPEGLAWLYTDMSFMHGRAPTIYTFEDGSVAATSYIIKTTDVDASGKISTTFGKPKEPVPAGTKRTTQNIRIETNYNPKDPDASGPVGKIYDGKDGPYNIVGRAFDEKTGEDLGFASTHLSGYDAKFVFSKPEDLSTARFATSTESMDELAFSRDMAMAQHALKGGKVLDSMEAAKALVAREVAAGKQVSWQAGGSDFSAVNSGDPEALMNYWRGYFSSAEFHGNGNHPGHLRIYGGTNKGFELAERMAFQEALAGKFGSDAKKAAEKTTYLGRGNFESPLSDYHSPLGWKMENDHLYVPNRDAHVSAGEDWDGTFGSMDELFKHAVVESKKPEAVALRAKLGVKNPELVAAGGGGVIERGVKKVLSRLAGGETGYSVRLMEGAGSTKTLLAGLPAKIRNSANVKSFSISPNRSVAQSTARTGIGNQNASEIRNVIQSLENSPDFRALPGRNSAEKYKVWARKNGQENSDLLRRIAAGGDDASKARATLKTRIENDLNLGKKAGQSRSTINDGQLDAFIKAENDYPVEVAPDFRGRNLTPDQMAKQKLDREQKLANKFMALRESGWNSDDIIRCQATGRCGLNDSTLAITTLAGREMDSAVSAGIISRHDTYGGKAGREAAERFAKIESPSIDDIKSLEGTQNWYVLPNKAGEGILQDLGEARRLAAEAEATRPAAAAGAYRAKVEPVVLVKGPVKNGKTTYLAYPEGHSKLGGMTLEEYRKANPNDVIGYGYAAEINGSHPSQWPRKVVDIQVDQEEAYSAVYRGLQEKAKAGTLTASDILAANVDVHNVWRKSVWHRRDLRPDQFVGPLGRDGKPIREISADDYYAKLSYDELVKDPKQLTDGLREGNFSEVLNSPAFAEGMRAVEGLNPKVAKSNAEIVQNIDQIKTMLGSLNDGKPRVSQPVLDVGTGSRNLSSVASDAKVQSEQAVNSLVDSLGQIESMKFSGPITEADQAKLASVTNQVRADVDAITSEISSLLVRNPERAVELAKKLEPQIAKVKSIDQQIAKKIQETPVARSSWFSRNKAPDSRAQLSDFQANLAADIRALQYAVIDVNNLADISRVKGNLIGAMSPQERLAFEANEVKAAALEQAKLEDGTESAMYFFVGHRPANIQRRADDAARNFAEAQANAKRAGVKDPLVNTDAATIARSTTKDPGSKKLASAEVSVARSELEVKAAIRTGSAQKVSEARAGLAAAQKHLENVKRVRALPALKANAKVGIFTGSFDPPHMDHLKIAQEMMRQQELDRIYLVPDTSKKYKTMVPVADRDEMLSRMTADIPGIEIFPHGLIGGEGEMWDAMDAVAKVHPDSKLHSVMGTDTFKWYQEKVPAENRRKGVTLLVNPRDRSALLPDELDGSSVVRVEARDRGISSTLVRNELRAGRTPRFPSGEPILHPAVAAYIKENPNFYGVDRVPPQPAIVDAVRENSHQEYFGNLSKVMSESPLITSEIRREASLAVRAAVANEMEVARAEASLARISNDTFDRAPIAERLESLDKAQKAVVERDPELASRLADTFKNMEADELESEFRRAYLASPSQENWNSYANFLRNNSRSLPVTDLEKAATSEKVRVALEREAAYLRENIEAAAIRYDAYKKATPSATVADAERFADSALAQMEEAGKRAKALETVAYFSDESPKKSLRDRIAASKRSLELTYEQAKADDLTFSALGKKDFRGVMADPVSAKRLIEIHRRRIAKNATVRAERGAEVDEIIQSSILGSRPSTAADSSTVAKVQKMKVDLEDLHAEPGFQGTLYSDTNEVLNRKAKYLEGRGWTPVQARTAINEGLAGWLPSSKRLPSPVAKDGVSAPAVAAKRAEANIVKELNSSGSESTASALSRSRLRTTVEKDLDQITRNSEAQIFAAEKSGNPKAIEVARKNKVEFGKNKSAMEDLLKREYQIWDNGKGLDLKLVDGVGQKTGLGRAIAENPSLSAQLVRKGASQTNADEVTAVVSYLKSSDAGEYRIANSVSGTELGVAYRQFVARVEALPASERVPIFQNVRKYSKNLSGSPLDESKVKVALEEIDQLKRGQDLSDETTRALNDLVMTKYGFGEAERKLLSATGASPHEVSSVTSAAMARSSGLDNVEAGRKLASLSDGKAVDSATMAKQLDGLGGQGLDEAIKKAKGFGFVGDELGEFSSKIKSFNKSQKELLEDASKAGLVRDKKHMQDFVGRLAGVSDEELDTVKDAVVLARKHLRGGMDPGAAMERGIRDILEEAGIKGDEGVQLASSIRTCFGL